VTGKMFCLPGGKDLSTEERVFSAVGFGFGAFSKAWSGAKNAGINPGAKAVAAKVLTLSEEFALALQASRRTSYKTLRGAVGALGDPFEATVGMHLMKNEGRALLGVGDDGVRKVLGIPKPQKQTVEGIAMAPDFLSATKGNEGRTVDLTPAAIGPYTIPTVNGEANLDAGNVNMVTCGGQATIPMVAAVSQVATVHYAEIVASVSSRSAGPGTRANIDEFTRTTAGAIEKVGGAAQGKAIIILNPAEPPMIMRDTVFTLSEGADEETIRASVEAMVKKVQAYVPGYRLKQQVQFERFGDNNKLKIPGRGEFTGIKTMILLEVEGAGDYLPSYSGNLDIMTAAAKATGELLAQRIAQGKKVAA